MLLPVLAFALTPQGPCSLGVGCQLPDQDPVCAGYSSDTSSDSSAADVFVCAADGVIDAICWWGSWQQGDFGPSCGPVVGEQFLVSYWSSPQPNWEPTQRVAGPFVVSPPAIQEFGQTCFGLDVFRFESAHPPVAVQRGDVLWIEIQARSGDSCRFIWNMSVVTDFRSAVRSTSMGRWFVLTYPGLARDLAFCVNVATYPLERMLGQNYCDPGASNSRGLTGQMDAIASEAVDANAIVMVAKRLPHGTVGVLLASETQGFSPSPGGSQGNLCLGGTLGVFSGQIGASNGNGWIETRVDVGSLPAPLTFVQPGETWHFQLWYRDVNPGPTSNFTNGLSIQFQ